MSLTTHSFARRLIRIKNDYLHSLSMSINLQFDWCYDILVLSTCKKSGGLNIFMPLKTINDYLYLS